MLISVTEISASFSLLAHILKYYIMLRRRQCYKYRKQTTPSQINLARVTASDPEPSRFYRKIGFDANSKQRSFAKFEVS